MQFEPSYFQNDIREGFYIPGMIKRSWAMQLEALNVVRDICEKHNITWYADCGTMLGAVRHRGFIPWDDDLDICMFRDEYIRFNEIVADELPEGYKVVTLENEPEYDVFLTRIVSTAKIDVSNGHLLDYHGYPYSSGIDVFALDYIYSDIQQEERRREKTLAVWQLAQQYENNEITAKEAERIVFELTGMRLDKRLSVKCAFVRIMDALFSECDGRGSTKIAPMHDYIRKPATVQEISWYKHTIDIPFENTTIRVPADYEKLLSTRYGKMWYSPNRHGGVHEYPFFMGQEKLLLEKKGAAPYVYSCNGIDEAIINRRNEHAFKVNAGKHILTVLKELVADIEEATGLLRKEYVAEALTNAQELAISLGTSLEQEIGEGTKVVSNLERFCEILFSVNESVFEEKKDAVEQGVAQLHDCFNETERLYYLETGEKKEIVFIPVKQSDWIYLEKLYEDYSQNDDTEVYVMPAYYADRADDGRLLEIKSDYELFSNSLNMVDPKTFDFSVHHPDKIVITNPFDEYQSGFSVHPYFYATKMYEYTDCLEYVQCFETDDISDDDFKSYTNARHYVMTPGVIYADRIVVASENIKKVYLKILSAEGVEEIEGFKKKIIVSDTIKPDADPKTVGKKYLIFNVAEGDLLCREDVFKKIDRCLDVFAENSDKIEIIWVEDLAVTEDLSKRFPEMYRKYIEVKTRFLNMNLGRVEGYDKSISLIEQASGYYGSTGYFMNQCVRNKVPSMIWDINIK